MNYVMSACLLQEERSVIYFLKTFQSAKINYDVSDKKLLTIVSTLRNWRIHLKETAHKIKILSNHNNLVKFITTKKLNRKQVRWSEKLISYNFDIEHVSRKHNKRANALSRRSDYKTSFKEEKSLLRWKNNRLELTKLSTSKTVSEEQQFKEHYSSEELRLLKKTNEDFHEKAEVLYFQESIFVSKKLEKDVLKENHDELLTDHKSVNVTWIRVSKKYFFSKMRKKIKKYIKKCEVCVKTKKSRQSESSMQSLEISNKSWQSVTMNFITDFSEFMNTVTQVGYDEILVMMNKFSKMTKFVLVKSKQTTEQLTYVLIKELMITEKVSEFIVFDRDKLFVLKFWTTLMIKLEIKKKMFTAFHSQTDEQIERLNQTLKQYLRAYINEKQNN